MESKTITPATKIENRYDLKYLDEYDTEIEWLNELLVNQDDLSDRGQLSLSHLETKLSKVLSVLELAISDTSTLVDKSIEEIVRSVPRLSLDLQLMRENALLLRYSLKSIHTQSLPSNESQSESIQPALIPSSDSTTNQASSDDTDKLLSHLSTLDLIKERMESARTVLREAEAWSTLESEVTGYLTDPIPSHLKAAERLAEAAKSMVVFQHTPEYEGRRGLMRSLQNELEASLSTNLVKALSDKDVRRCKEFYEIFKMIEREGEFKNYYFGSRRSAISSLWNQAMLEPPILTTRSVGPSIQNTQIKLSAKSLPMFLAKQFYPELLRLLQTEMDFLPSIFTNPIEALTAFLKSVLDNLKPSISTRLIENVECAHVLASWPSLVSCWNLTEDVGHKLESLISQLELKLKRNIDSTSPTSPILQLGSVSSKSDRRTSFKRPTSRSIGSRSGTDLLHHEDSSTTASHAPQIIKDWETSLYEPFIDFQSNYFERELNFLRASLKNIILGLSAQPTMDATSTGQKLTVTMIQQLPQVLESIFTLADKALDRCEAFTHGYGVLGYAKAVDLMLSEYLDTNRQTLITERENRQKRKEQNARLDGNNASGKSRGPATSSSYLDESASQMLELEGLDYSSEDWEVFQLGLKLLATCKTIHDKLSEYEKKTHKRLIEILASLRSKSSDESIAVNEDLEPVKIKLSKGAKVILEQSLLNSSELWEFYETLQSSERGSNTPNPLGPRKDKSFSLSSGENKRHSNHGMKPMISQARSLFHKSNLSVSNLIKESQQIVQSIILLPLLKQVEEYPHQTIWTQSTTELQRQKQTSSISTIDLKILNQFSKSPTEAISKLGEGLFNLPRLFEIYTTVDEDALAFSLETLPFVDFFEVLSNWQAFHQSAVPNDNDDQSGTPSSKEREKKLENHLSSEMVISTWLSSLTLAVVNQFSHAISNTFLFNNSQFNHSHLKSTPKNRLSSDGLAQLLVDLDYLHNVVRALDVEDDVLDKLKSIILG
ncbi:uncharacterized protein PGTG_09981 [Puccinia graminis f. sp. tritici CRL 75-36-700-3]|uniref:Conserved oligomeric Golgi complex subunit 7 n=1 Tax=Puccinia graminis f. sp. tritici (strain CRL 75-36-700-3 / race SCCL) TaxID=418459 RepID=E3KEV7_PUCGT|nr:uncharacterized protein PGTG_09981 [Puccinia graminis f. sp. tritici CRL 75-36-700-3]EFP83013.1 hypothetical protein PGTG_09981 [Puccinia graminis f. sp. tritici CRL 75-36-700-3]